MYLRQTLKSNKGSSLIVVIMIIVLMSLLGVTFMAVTMSDLQMSGLYSDVNRAYHVAEAGVEQVARVLDDKVAAIQENARNEADEHIKNLLETNPAVRNGDGSIKEDVVKNEFDTKYIATFNSDVREEFSNVNTLDEMKSLLGIDPTTNNETFAGKDIEPEGGSIVLESAEPKEILDGSGNLDAYHVNITVKGIYNNYKKRLSVTFNLLPEPKKAAYNPVLKSIVNRAPNKPKILEKALVAEKNIISVDGSVNITGNVLCFGTIPTNNGNEDQNATWDGYGGIMAGMCSDIYNNSSQFGFDPSKVSNQKMGNIIVNGDVATFAYIHTLYGTRLNHSDITVHGKAFARSVRSEENSNFSTINLNNVYTTDNLQIDSNASTITVGGNYYGFVDAGYAIQGGIDTSDKDSYEYKRTSSIVVNGDSTLNLNGEVYIGGSTFFKNFVDASEHPYMTGISALKSSRRVTNAFTKDDSSNPNNYLYWYDQTGQLTSTASRYGQYSGVDMMIGRASDQNNPPFFPIQYRAMHFKGIWENLWKNDGVFSTFINADNIKINTINGKLNGYSNGAIVANGVVYDPYRDFNQLHDDTNFHTNIQQPSIKAFYDSVSDLLIDAYSQSAPKLDYVAPTKHISSYMDTNYTVANKVAQNKVYSVNGKGIVYYGSGNTEIYFDNLNWNIKNDSGSELIPLTKGIIYVDGNVYINNGFNFNGIIMATGNIVFLGNANISYDGTVINDLINSNVNISGLFRMNTYEIPSGDQQSQRIQQKNIDVIEWKEIPLN